MSRIKFTKQGLTVSAQIQLLLSRGLIINDLPLAERCLTQIGYYRFSGYMLPFQIPIGSDPHNPHKFLPHITMERIIELYEFDRKLRLLVMDALERIEIFIRSAISNCMSPRYGAHWYLDANLYKQHIIYADLINSIKHQIGHGEGDRKNRDVHIAHYYATYDDPDMPACWMVKESVSFSTISMILKGISPNEILYVGKYFGQNHEVFCSWVHSLSYARNLCAHHGRLWNRVLTIKPIIPRQLKQAVPTNDRIYAILYVVQLMMMKLSPANEWADSLNKLLTDFPSIPENQMGFPAQWRTKAIWQLTS